MNQLMQEVQKGCGKRIYNYNEGCWGSCGDKFLENHYPKILLCEVCGFLLVTKLNNFAKRGK